MSKLEFNEATPLYTSDARAWSIDQLPEVLLALQQTAKPIVIFVHGRGKEPNKSLRGGTYTTGLAVHKIERGYDASVLMFNWNSAFRGLNIFDREVPLANTPAGGLALGRMLNALREFRDMHPTVKPSLLVHSMGSVVVQRAIQDGHWPDSANLFTSILFSQPDADDVGHAAWLEQLALRENVFVTQNRDDHVLLRATDARPAGAQPLGLGTSQPLAPHARYVDLSNMGPLGKKDDDHEVFGKGAMNGQLHVCRFFTQALTGQSVILDQAVNVDGIDREVVYRLKSQADSTAPCLKIPVLPSS